MTTDMLNLQFNAVVLYPAGHDASRILYDATVRYPAGWTAATALDVDSKQGDVVDYQAVPLDILVDSPVFAGGHFRRFDLTPGDSAPVRLNVVADEAHQLEAEDAHIEQHRALVRQALKLFGARHYDHYDFLLGLTGRMSGIGLEHQRSSENTQDTDYFTGWDEKAGTSSLLAHEMVHSWNGKYRRPADLWTPNYNVPMQDSLLWVYEGQTQYWGEVLNARSGLRPLPAARDELASLVAYYTDNRPGLAWRSVQDTTNDPIITARGGKPYRNWQLSEDYYRAGQLIWLEADVRIRDMTKGRKSLDDFARAFFGQDDGVWKVQDTYTFEDVVSTLNGVVEHDWNTFLRERLDGEVPLTGGLEASGWRVVYKSEPTALEKAKAKNSEGRADFTYSLGLWTDKEGEVGEAVWDGPAFDAGIGTGMKLVAVNDTAWSKAVLEQAIKEAKGNRSPIRLLVREFDHFRSIDVDYHGGLRYPHLERIEGTTDYLTPILTARK